jgi:hypothetical protein
MSGVWTRPVEKRSLMGGGVADKRQPRGNQPEPLRLHLARGESRGPRQERETNDEAQT